MRIESEAGDQTRAAIGGLQRAADLRRTERSIWIDRISENPAVFAARIEQSIRPNAHAGKSDTRCRAQCDLLKHDIQVSRTRIGTGCEGHRKWRERCAADVLHIR